MAGVGVGGGEAMDSGAELGRKKPLVCINAITAGKTSENMQ
jgi:hypothetical protein